MAPRVWVIAEDPLAREGLIALLERAGLEALASDIEPGSGPGDVIVIDPGPDPDEITPPPAGGLGILLVDDAATRAQAIGAGWRGALGRQIGAERLGAAVFAVAAGLVVSDAAAALATEEDAGAPVRLREPLTSREGEVLQLLASGFSNRRIGQRLGISEHTAKFHVAAVLGKLEARTRTDAVVRAARLGLIVL